MFFLLEKPYQKDVNSTYNMKKVKNRHSVARSLLLGVSLFLSLNAGVYAQDTIPEGEASAQEAEQATAGADVAGGDAAKGKEIFNTLCAACHKLDSKSIGPALRGVTERRDKEWLHNWIHNSGELIASGDETAVALYEEFQVAMPAFPQLSDGDINDVLAYVGQPKAAPKAAETGAAAGEAASGGGGGISTDILL